MSDALIIYALVARGQNVLAEHTESSGNFTTVTRMLLQKIRDDVDARASYEYDEYVFHYQVSQATRSSASSLREQHRPLSPLSLFSHFSFFHSRAPRPNTHTQVRNGITHLCMTEAAAGKRLPFDFLEVQLCAT